MPETVGVVGFVGYCWFLVTWSLFVLAAENQLLDSQERLVTRADGSHELQPVSVCDLSFVSHKLCSY